jgi:outer membrane protein TolC
LARETARLAGENVDYQRARFDNGAATALDVAEALQDQRDAQLQVAQLRAETATRRLALEDLTGTLLGRLTLDEVPSE